MNCANSKIKLGGCQVQDETGGFVARKMGPYFTTGGNSWIEFGTNDVGVTELLKDKPEGVVVTALSNVAVDVNGNPIGFPPIHIHHWHWLPGETTLWRRDPMKCALGQASQCFQETAGFETHGDYQCLQEDGGLSCLNLVAPERTGRLVKDRHGLQSHCQDVRIFGSEPIEWYAQWSFHWKHPSNSLKVLSTFEFLGPGLRGDGTTELSHLVRTDRESWYWYTNQFRRNGQLVHMKLHTHAKAFREILLFHGSIDDLGLNIPHMKWAYNANPDRYKSMYPDDFGFSSNANLKAYILRKLDQKVVRNPTTSSSLKCIGYGSLERVGGFAFDRRPKVCCKPWNFKEGDVFTVVSFYDYNASMVDIHAPKRHPPLYPMHVGMFFHYIATDTPGTTYWETELGTQQIPTPLYNIVDHDLMNQAIGSLNMMNCGGTCLDDISWYEVKYVQWSTAALICKDYFLSVVLSYLHSTSAVVGITVFTVCTVCYFARNIFSHVKL